MTDHKYSRQGQLAFLVAAAMLLQACSDSPTEQAFDSLDEVDEERIINADSEPGNWLSHGRTYDEQRFSPLKQITSANVDQLGLSWYFDTDTNRGHEASPIVVDGVMFITAPWSLVYALDARTGQLLWKYDPVVPKSWGANACCDVVNRGVAVWQGKVYVGTLDGYLVALNARNGKVVWKTLTIDPVRPYTITGAPRIVKNKVVIGNGGAEYGVRGYVSAYDVDSGEMAWRFYTVPGNPADGFENEAMRKAAETWTGEWWKIGGGGTAWDSMAYDAELGLLYVGTGNGSPWSREKRSPGGGDNLYLSSIVALDADTGEYRWHYQTTPGDNWDYTATQHLILADLELDGRQRKVIMQAPKNGFFYLVDRENGEFISAEPYGTVTWANRINPETGRPEENPKNTYGSGLEGAKLVFPSPYGAHNWQPMSFSPDTGLVYIPSQEIPFGFAGDDNFVYAPFTAAWNTGIMPETTIPPTDINIVRWLRSVVKGRLLAWDPVTQQERWKVQYDHPWNAGVLSTAGNLVFHGSGAGLFAAYDATSGEKKWETEVQTGIIAPPVTYSVDGEQYVALMAGYGGAFALTSGWPNRTTTSHPVGRLLVFKLGGTAQLPALPDPVTPPRPPELTGSALNVAQGEIVYHRYCAACHGAGAVSSGLLPDLRHMAPDTHRQFEDIVLRGIRSDKGMVSFAPLINAEETKDIHTYLIHRAHQDYPAP